MLEGPCARHGDGEDGGEEDSAGREHRSSGEHNPTQQACYFANKNMFFLYSLLYLYHTYIILVRYLFVVTTGLWWTLNTCVCVFRYLSVVTTGLHVFVRVYVCVCTHP